MQAPTVNRAATQQKVPAQVLIPEVRHETRRRRTWIAVVLLVATAVVLTVVEIATRWPAGNPNTVQQSHLAPGQIALPTHEPRGWSVSYPITLPRGYQQMYGMAADPSGRGVWVVASSARSTTLFRWATATRRFTAYPMDAFTVAAFNPMAIDHDGNAWIGFNTALVEVNPVTGRSRVVDSAPDPYASGPSPSPIVSIAIGGNGSIVVGRSPDSDLQIINPHTLKVALVALPVHTALVGEGGNSLASSGGDIVAILYSSPGIYEVGQYINGKWTLSNSRCSVYSASVTAGELIVSGWQCDLEGAPADSGPTSLSRLDAPKGAGPQEAIALSDGELISGLKDGAMAFGPDTGAISLALGRMGYGPPTTPRRVFVHWPTSLPVTATSLSWGGERSAWFVPQGGDRIGRITEIG